MHSVFSRALTEPVRDTFLIAYTDWAGYQAIVRNLKDEQTFRMLNEFSVLSEQAAVRANGRVIKYLADSALMVFPKEESNNAVLSLVEHKREVEEWFEKNRIRSSLAINCHLGEAILGRMGGDQTGYLDLIGHDVNICFSLKSKHFGMSPQVFRSLSPENRKHFHKFTPPIVYNLNS